MDHDVPVIFGLEHYCDLKCSSNEYEKHVYSSPVRKSHAPDLLERRQWTCWSSPYTNDVLFTKEELREIHTQFGHPSTDALINIFKKAKPDIVDPSVRKTLQGIADRCAPCQTWAPRSARFRVSLPMDNKNFNHEIQVDVMFIDGDPELHIFDRGTRYSVAKFMDNQTAEHTWDLIVEFWISVFTGYPDVISHD